MVQPFEQLGPYKLGRKLGQGGMGAVYEAVDTETGQVVAVKVLAPALAAEEGFRGRFEAEIESLKTLRHPNIVRLFGYGEEHGSMFYAMERVDGTSLEEEIRQGRRFDWREATQIAIKMCRALKHAHDNGIIHRDIKPANILMATNGQVKLSDFGIARLFGNTGMTSEGGVLGTAEYMAPEQADGRPVTDRCDQYSLGGVMYALLAGRPPFRATSFVEMLQLQRYSDPQPVRRYAPDTPAELDRIVAQLLEKEPAKRFVNTLMLAKALEAMEKGLSVSSARDDFVVADPKRTTQPQLTGLDPYAATLVPVEQPVDADAAARAARDAGTLIQIDQTSAPGVAASAATSTTRFTKVREGDHEAAKWYTEIAQGLVTPQSLALLLALVFILGTAWYLLKPPTADELYERAMATIGEGTSEEVRMAESDIDAFLNRFPEDARAAEFDEFKSQLQLERRARNARLSARAPGNLKSQSPLERSYIEATALALVNPEAAVNKLQAIVDLYADAELQPSDGGEFVDISRQELSRLKQQLAESTAEQLKLLKARAQHAEEISAKDTAGAKRIWRGIVELYGEKPWAAGVVAAARKHLAAEAVQP